MFRIVTDTSANLPTAYLQQEHITIIPFTFHADGDEQACLDLNTFDAKTFYAQMRSGTKVSTSQIPPQRYLDVLTPMLEAGEDIRFIGRRLVIAASEDVGLADSNALRVALDAARAAEMVGMPEARIPLAHATVYLATAPKSNSAYMGINAAMNDVRNGKTLAVPEHLRTPTRKKMAAAGGADAARLEYLYSHDYPEHYVPQAYLPEGRVYYTPTRNGLELRISERMEYRRKMAEEAVKGPDKPTKE